MGASPHSRTSPLTSLCACGAPGPRPHQGLRRGLCTQLRTSASGPRVFETRPALSPELVVSRGKRGCVVTRAPSTVAEVGAVKRQIFRKEL